MGSTRDQWGSQDKMTTPSKANQDGSDMIYRYKTYPTISKAGEKPPDIPCLSLLTPYPGGYVEITIHFLLTALPLQG